VELRESGVVLCNLFVVVKLGVDMTQLLENRDACSDDDPLAQ
jgi:hypothetical protein